MRPSVVGCKVSNIYDINSKVYLLKLQRKGFRCLLLLESGVRFHLTEYQREKSNIPSNYTMKLRKHLRNRRVTRVSQLGADRAIDIQFGRGDGSENRVKHEVFQGFCPVFRHVSGTNVEVPAWSCLESPGETAFHLILEIYVSGNLILTDHEYQILALLRVHNDQETKAQAVRGRNGRVRWL